MDTKFEVALQELVENIEKFVTNQENTTTSQYQGFNDLLQEAMTKHTEQVDELVKQLNVDIQDSKAKIQAVEKEINEVDINAKKSVEKVQDKIEVERCVMEMVSWVSEQLTNQQVVDNLNVVADKFNVISNTVANELSKPKKDKKPKQAEEKKTPQPDEGLKKQPTITVDDSATGKKKKPSPAQDSVEDNKQSEPNDDEDNPNQLKPPGRRKSRTDPQPLPEQKQSPAKSPSPQQQPPAEDDAGQNEDEEQE